MNLGPLQIVAPLLLFGLLAAGIPVLLHLLAKVRAPQVYFPTLRFLRMAMDKTARRRKVQHWLLLLLRMAALAVLAMALAQPLVRSSSGQLGSDRDTAVVLVVDNSISMDARAAGRTRLESARASALAFLRDHHFPQTALIATNGAAARRPPTELIDRFRVIDDLEKLGGGAGRADLAAAIARAQELLARTGQPNREIYVFTDLQAVSTAGLETLPPFTAAKQPPAVLIVTPGPADPFLSPTNLAVTEVRIDQPALMAAQPIAVEATVRNFSRLAQKATVRLFQDGVEQGGETVQVVSLSAAGEPGATARVRFWPVSFAEPGSHRGRVEIKRLVEGAAARQGAPPDDDLPEDDARCFALVLADRIDVLLVKGRDDLDASSDAGYWLARLMASGGPRGPIRLVQTTADQFTEPGLLANVEVAITSDVPSLSAAQLSALRAFAEAGGTWLVWLGPSADLNAFNDQVGGLVGCRADRYEGAGAGGSATEGQPLAVAWVDESHPMFRDLYPPSGSAPFQQVLAYRHAVLSRPAGAPGKVLARLSNNDPLVVETPVGRGRVVLFATAATPRWTSWLTADQGQAFAVYQLLLAAGARGREPTAFEVSENQSAPVGPAGAAGAAVSVQLPDERVVTAKDAAAWSPSGEFIATDQIGLYRWEVTDEAGESAVGWFAVNPPADESDLTPLPPEQVASLMADRVVLAGASLAELAERVNEHRRGSPVWPYLLAAVLVLLAVEAKLANRDRPAVEMAVTRTT